MLARLFDASRRGATAFARAFSRSYASGLDVAGGSGRWPAQAMMTAPVAQTAAARALAARRIAYLAESSPLAASIIGTFVSGAVADGPTVRCAVVDDDERADLERRWASFYAACDQLGQCDLGGMLAGLTRGYLIDGEALLMLVVTGDGQLRLRRLAASQVDHALTRPSLRLTGEQTPRISFGIEQDAAGTIIAYWVLPSQDDLPWASVAPPTRVDASDIVHLIVPRFPGQLRGISPLAPVATRLLQLDQTEDAAAQKALVNALFTGFVRDIDGSSGIAPDNRALDPAGMSLEPGTLRILPPGTDVTFTPQTDMSTIDGILRHMARSACAGAGVPYMLAAGDLAETSFSSAQLGMHVFRRQMRAFQQSHLVAQVLAPIWRRFVLLEVLTGRIRARDFERDPESYLSAAFLFPGWPALDPLKQSKADALDLSSRTRSRAEIISERGRDAADVDAEIEADPFSPGDTTTSAAAIAAQPETADDVTP